MNVLIIAGEVSADIYGSFIAKEMKQQCPDVCLHSFGGDELKKTSDIFHLHIATKNRVGVHLFRKGPDHKLFFQTLASVLKNTDISRAVLIDFDQYNFKIAAILQSKNIPIITFITPNFWMWKDVKKAKKISSYSQKIITIFPQEFEFYTPIHKEVYFFGHPLVEMLQFDQASLTEPLISKPIISLFPGSRQQELDLYLESMLTSISAFSDQASYQYVIAISSPHFKDQIEDAVKKQGVSVIFWEGRPETLFKASRVSICASGTATLQAVLTNTPVIVLAALPAFTYFVAKYIFRIKLPFITLPNIIANEAIVPELVQAQITVPKLVQCMKEILETPRSHIAESYKKVQDVLIGKQPIVKSIVETILSNPLLKER